MARSVLLGILFGTCAYMCVGVSLETLTPLSLRRAITRTIDRGEVHTYLLQLSVGQCASMRLLQVGIDVWLKAYSPAGKAVLDLNWDNWGEENYTLCSNEAGKYKLLVQASGIDTNRGQYVLSLRSISPERPADLAAMKVQDSVAKAIHARIQTQPLEEALETFRAQGNQWAQMKTHSHLARSYHRNGEYGPTVKHQQQALNIAHRLGDRFEEAISNRELFRVYGHIGEQSRRMAARRIAIALLRDLGDPRTTVTAAELAAEQFSELRQYEKALVLERRLLKSCYTLGLADRRRIALGKIAGLESKLGRHEEAVRSAREYLEESKATGLAHHQAAGYFTLGHILLGAGQLVEAENRFQTAAALDRMTGDRSAEAVAQAAIADVAFRRGDLQRALRHVKWAIRHWNWIEIAAGPAKWQAGTENEVRHRFQVRVLSALHRQEPTEGYDLMALKTCDGMRAGYLGADTSSIAEMRMLAGDNAVVLEFFVGPEVSLAWALDKNTVQTFELAREDVLRPLVDQLHGAVLARNRWISSESAQQRAVRIANADRRASSISKQLGKLLLSPLAPFLGNRKLLIVADGPLEHLPFASLQDPVDPDGRPLGHVRDLVSMPSVGAILALHRRRSVDLPAFADELAVLADPVFRKDDPRVRPSGYVLKIPDPVPTAARNVGWRELPRLLYSRIEAEAIASYAHNPVRLLDFDASRQQFLSGKLNRARVIHIAAHGISNSEDPDLSGLILSMVDRSGKPQEGFLRFKDIYNSQLTAELVVLSACQTAIGKRFHESGMMPLSGAFLHAGAARVVSTLWKIDDAATADFMRIFYRELLSEGKSPSSALRIAQTELSSKPRWKSPYYWGAFVLQGWPH